MFVDVLDADLGGLDTTGARRAHPCDTLRFEDVFVDALPGDAIALPFEGWQAPSAGPAWAQPGAGRQMAMTPGAVVMPSIDLPAIDLPAIDAIAGMAGISPI